MAFKVWILCNIVAFSHSFLFDVTTNKPSTLTINKNQYDDLLKMLVQEHSDRVQLQGVVEEQKREIIQHRTALMELNSRLERLEGTTAPTSTHAQPNFCRELEQKYQSLSQQHLDLTQKYSSLYQEHKVLTTAFRTEKNRTAKLEKDVTALNTLSDKLLAAANQSSALEKDVAALKQVQAVGQLQAIADLQNVTSKIQTDVNQLLSNSQARAQDFLSLYNQFTASANDRKIFEDIITTNISRIELDVESIIQNLNHSLDHLQTELVSLKTPVGFTAFGTPFGTLSSGTIIKFPSIASSFGLTGLSSIQSTGVFRAEKEGVYLIITSIMVSATRDDTFFNIYKNNQRVVSHNMYYAGKSGTAQHNSYSSGTGSLVLQLSVGDTVDVRTGNTMDVYQYASSLTVIKIN